MIPRATLLFPDPPYCEDESIVEYGVAAEECINITCKVKSNPPPMAYRWLLVSEVEGIKLHTNQSQTLETDDDTLVYQRPNGTTSMSLSYVFSYEILHIYVK